MDIVINGRRLIDLARGIEQPFATTEKRPYLAGAYQNLEPWAVLLPAQYLLPENDNHIPVLIYGACGDWGCWPLEARITVETDKVIWHNFY